MYKPRSQEKKLRSTPKEASTSRITSSWHHVDSQFSDSQSSPTKSSFPNRKGARIDDPSCSSIITPTRVSKPIPVSMSTWVAMPIDIPTPI